jgi:hypothetical protein
MYANRYGDQYPGGVLWLDVGPDRRSAESVTPILQRIATYAYAADVQAQSLLENAVFGPDVVRALLDRHGTLLVVIDDVWDPTALRELKDALPAGAFILLTTRDYDVAYALENDPAAIQALDVLSKRTRVCCCKGARLVYPIPWHDQVSPGLGAMPGFRRWLTGALNRRGPPAITQTATELLRR